MEGVGTSVRLDVVTVGERGILPGCLKAPGVTVATVERMDMHLSCVKVRV